VVSGKLPRGPTSYFIFKYDEDSFLKGDRMKRDFDWTKLSNSDLLAWFASESVHLTMHRPEQGCGFEEVARRFIACHENYGNGFQEGHRVNQEIFELLDKLDELLLKAKIELGQTDLISYDTIKDARLFLYTLRKKLE
jgi:hypothetical protein